MNSTIGTERRNLIEDSEHIQLLSNNLLAQHHPLANLGLIFAIHLNLVQTKVSNSLVWDKTFIHIEILNTGMQQIYFEQQSIHRFMKPSSRKPDYFT